MSTSATTAPGVPTPAPGPEFTFFPGQGQDRLVGLVWQLAQELQVTRQRTLALESLLVARGVVEAGELDAFQPDDDVRSHLARDARALVERLVLTVSETDDHRVPMRGQYAGRLAPDAAEGTG